MAQRSQEGAATRRNAPAGGASLHVIAKLKMLAVGSGFEGVKRLGVATDGDLTDAAAATAAAGDVA